MNQRIKWIFVLQGILLFSARSFAFENPAIDSVLTLLPAKIVDVVSAETEIHFEKTPDFSEELVIPNCEVAISETYAYTEKKNQKIHIWLHPKLEKVLLEGEAASTPIHCPGNPSRYHQNSFRFAQGIVIHEILHAYRFLVKPKNEKFLDQMLAFKKNEVRNFQREKSIDEYEFKNKEEYLATNFEYFILDPEYQCKKPVENNYFQNEFQHNPHPQTRCPDIVKLKMMEAGKGEVFLNFNNVYRIDYLLAGKGKGIGGFGHSMLRLVVCAPYRKQVDAQCLKDTSFHLVITFRADTGTEGVSILKGILPYYPSKLFVSTFRDIIEQYNISEFRDVNSHPLELSDEQKKFFLQTIHQKHWMYEGKYAFLTNNCATETIKLISTSTGQKNIDPGLIATPTEVVKLLKNSQLLSQAEEPQVFVSKKNLVMANFQKLIPAEDLSSLSKIEAFVLDLEKGFLNHLQNQNLNSGPEMYSSILYSRAILVKDLQGVMKKKMNKMKQTDEWKDLIQKIEENKSEPESLTKLLTAMREQSEEISQKLTAVEYLNKVILTR